MRTQMEAPHTLSEDRSRLPYDDGDTRQVPLHSVGFEPRNPHAGQSGSSASGCGHVSPHGRRSSVTEMVTAFGDAGGVNSFNNFARSWQRAAIFPEFLGGRQSFAQPNEDDQPSFDIERTEHNFPIRPRHSLLRAAFENEGSQVAEISESPIIDNVATDDESPHSLLSGVERRLSERRSSLQLHGAIHLDPALMSPFGGSYGAVPPRLDEASVIPSRLRPEVVRAERADPRDRESEPLLTKRDETEDKVALGFVVGQSTVPQTVFNSVNTLIGVGMLSLPLSLRYSGWVFGLAFFLFASVVTSYTARLLAKCLDVDASLITFADLAYISFGPHARIAVSVLFCLELIAACVALVVLFADSVYALVEAGGVLEFKLISAVITVPLAFIPLRFLSFSSVLGIVCGLTIVVAILVNGVIKREGPGSLRHPAATCATPSDWRTLPLAYGLLMAPWGGHSVFPNIYRDMRHPMKYGRAVNYTYVFTLCLEVVIAAVGYAMFGDEVRDEITSNIFLTSGYPRWISYVIAIAVCIIPLTKIPLNARPVYSTAEFFLGLTKPGASLPFNKRASPTVKKAMVILIRVLLTILFVVMAILVPSFDRILAFVGSLACSLVCVVLPCSFHLKMFGRQLSRKQKVVDCTLIAIFLGGGIIGTICAFVPKQWIGADG